MTFHHRCSFFAIGFVRDWELIAVGLTGFFLKRDLNRERERDRDTQRDAEREREGGGRERREGLQTDTNLADKHTGLVCENIDF